jgi:hypothetical protein
MDGRGVGVICGGKRPPGGWMDDFRDLMMMMMMLLLLLLLVVESRAVAKLAKFACWLCCMEDWKPGRFGLFGCRQKPYQESGLPKRDDVTTKVRSDLRKMATGWLFSENAPRKTEDLRYTMS